MLRKSTLTLAVCAMLISSSLAITSPVNVAMPASDMQKITLNTGFNHDTQKAFVVPTPDVFWTVIKDPIPSPQTTESRAADTLAPYGGAWKPPQGINESQWISYIPGGSKYIKQGPYYYQKCFCLTNALWQNEEAIAQSSLEVSVRSDDAFYLGLNIMPDPTPGNHHLASGGGVGGFNTPPAVWKITGNDLVKLLHQGRNCLTVRVDDIGGVVTGFNLKGSLTTTGIDGIARATPSGPQFDKCSSCKGTKADSVSDVKNIIEGALQRDSARPPQK